MIIMQPFFLMFTIMNIIGLVYSIINGYVAGIIMFSTFLLAEAVFLFYMVVYRKNRPVEIRDYSIEKFNDYGLCSVLEKLADNRELPVQVSEVFQYGNLDFVPFELGCNVLLNGKNVYCLTGEQKDELMFNMANFELAHYSFPSIPSLYFKMPKNKPADAAVDYNKQYSFIAIGIKQDDKWSVFIDVPQK